MSDVPFVELMIPQGIALRKEFDLVDMDGVGLHLDTGDALSLRIYRGDGSTVAVSASTSAASAGGTTIALSVTTSPPKATIVLSAADSAGLGPGPYSFDLRWTDSSASSIVKPALLGVAHVWPTPSGTATAPEPLLPLGAAVSYLGIRGDDAMLLGRVSMLKQSIESAVRAYCGQRITQGTYTHFFPRASSYPSAPRQIIRLRERPVRSITTVHVDWNARAGQNTDPFASATLLEAGSQYWLDLDESGVSRRGHLVRVNGNWPTEAGSVKVVYVAGYTEAELAGHVADPLLDASDIRLAVQLALQVAVARAKDGSDGALSSESLSDHSRTRDVAMFGPGALPEPVRALLNRFTPKVVG